MKIISWLSYVVSCFFMGCGFNKIFYYKNYESIGLQSQNVNAYVGGDAYNYIINSERAVAYFVLALIFVIVGSTFMILNKMKNKEGI